MGLRQNGKPLKKRPGRTAYLEAGDRQAEARAVWHAFRTQRPATCQLELQLEELEAAATEDEIMADKAIATAPSPPPNPPPNARRRPSRKPFPGHLPRERVVIAAPAACTWLAVRPGS